MGEFQAIARFSSFTKAAEELNISQSALSKHISALENELGIKLFQRSSHKIVLTEAGKQFLETSQKIERLMDELNHSLNVIRSNQRPRMLIVSQFLLIHYGIMDSIWLFQQKYPDIPVRASDKAHRFKNPFLFDDVTFAFTRRIPVTSTAKYEYTLFAPDVCAIAVSQTHPLATTAYITWQDLVGLHIFCLNEDQAQLLQLKMQQLGAKADVNILHNVSIETALHFVRHDGSVLLCSKLQFESNKIPGTKVLVIKPHVEQNIYLARRRGTILTKEEKLFWQFIQEHYSCEGFQENN